MIALAWFLIGYGCGGICVVLAMWWVRGHKADFPPAEWDDTKENPPANNWTMVDECEKLRLEQEVEALREDWESELSGKKAKWPTPVGTNGNITHVSAYTRRKQNKKPKGAPK